MGNNKQIGYGLMLQGRFEEAIDAFRKQYNLCKKKFDEEKDKKSQLDYSFIVPYSDILIAEGYLLWALGMAFWTKEKRQEAEKSFRDSYDALSEAYKDSKNEPMPFLVEHLLTELIKEKKALDMNSQLKFINDWQEKHTQESETEEKVETEKPSVANEEILTKVISIENRIAKFMKPELPMRAVARGKEEKADYELLSSGKNPKPLFSEQVKAIRTNNGSGIKNEIFIDDERKDVFVNSKYAGEFKDLMYAMLMHFVIHDGVGGNNENLYKGVWGDAVAAEDNRDDAIQQAVKRFRKILRNYKLGEVPGLSKSRYAASKTYVMKPKPQYCILRRIEKEIEE